jgi:hypothetical protein
VTGDPVAVLDRLRAGHPGWTIAARPGGLAVFTAERSDPDGRHVHYAVAPGLAELSAKLEAADQELSAGGPS